MTSSVSTSEYDVVIVGGGHNGLTAAAYLARAGLSVAVLERLDHTGGAAVSARAFPGRPTRLSRYSYLVSLLPDQVVRDLGLDLRLAPRVTASYTPVMRDGVPGGLLVERPEGAATAASFRSVTGSDAEYEAWRAFYAAVGDLAGVVAPTLTAPLPREGELRARVDARIWRDLVERPLGEAVERRFADDTVRGVVATDALIGTFASLRAGSLVQNRCFLYHLIGNGTGEWQVPVGGMGAVTEALATAATAAGAVLVTDAEVTAIRPEDGGAEVRVAGRTLRTRFVLANVAPWVLAGLLGETPDPAARPVGAQLKVNLLLDRLPRLRSGADPRTAFAGTLHLGEGYDELETAYAQAAAGQVPIRMPGEVYCHSLTDPTILGDVPEGTHTLTYFGLHLPATLFDDPATRAERKAEAVARAIASLDEHLIDPIASVVARDADGRPCIEAKIPQDIEADLNMPGGHIFHGDLAWPWADDRADLTAPADRWGVATDHPAVLLCGSGARRGGAVSGLGGHNAARAVLESR
ncbi:phytoene desaturase family protein [Myceligenerans pegani]|uniref:Pyridine nucleotide-disulfide oxidoreductase domain-containing protein 2 n=1 Tax=Myceligenerans pegani TaxID=2776917 RepID=A0ABR9MWN8_9MICO|nr:NAD(P)/FAD-dependent oxidoreductase [Myceligenerans sp. TRM 65318]MBE1875802.1 NAD(P)/FAD-dependent oxidoreductase [Myceligenerans sp. TRM 65318]MBE3018073.1 NAD(P)/FAD-dependent oxidoreductase [Myceligenerans sp. TRM 65318]